MKHCLSDEEELLIKKAADKMRQSEKMRTVTSTGFLNETEQGILEESLLPEQGISMKPNASVEIGEGSWIGTKAVIVGDVKIGRHCVIGAGSVVTKDVPDYSIVVGSPAKVIKHYDFTKGEWVRY